jgi:uncharacterized protein YjbI with pentapeptide repeats
MAEAGDLKSPECGFDSRRGHVSKSALPPPAIEPLRLPALVDGSVQTLLTRSDHDGVRFSGQELSGRELGGSRFVECEFAECTFGDTNLGGVRLIDCRWSGCDAPVLRGARGTWRGVEVLGTRIGSAELYDSQWHSVRVADCKLGYLNFRHSTLQDVLFSGCTFDELDLGGATLTRVAFQECEIQTLTMTGARLKDVDLRGAQLRAINGLPGLSGATIDQAQLVELAPLLAAEAGIVVL